jgi:site-specific recombinase XerD
MAIRPDPKSPGMWIVDCRPGGYKSARERHRVDSEEAAERLHADLMRSRPQTSAPLPAQMTCAAIFHRWIAAYRIEKAARTAEDAEDCWQTLKAYFGLMLPKNLTEEHIERFRNALAKRVKPRTVNKHLSYLSSMLKWAAAKKLCPPLPFSIKGFEAKKTRAPKPRVITQEQVTRIYEAIDQEYKLAFLLMADAGLRRNEALGLRREHVELDTGLIFVVGKGSKERIVPITTDRLRRHLEEKRTVKGYLTFNQQTGKPFLSIRKALARASVVAGVDKHVYHHLLRHSFGTNSTVAGIDVSALQAIMGHSSVETTQRYQHLAGDYLREQAKKFQNSVHVDKKSDSEGDTATY